jgi:RNA polymerase sigma-70 factor (sigma-E family)
MRQRGDFESFVQASSTRLLRSAYLLCGDRGAAEDILQLTLMRVSAHWRVAAAAPEAYARQVLVNLSRDRARRSLRRVREVAWGELAAREPEGHDHARELAGRSAVMAALAQLPARQREVLVLRFYGDLSVADTAAATGATEGTVKSHTSRALSRMRELLDDPVPGGFPR